jgi:hypothetical protein
MRPFRSPRAWPTRQRRDPAIAVSAMLARNIDDIRCQCGAIVVGCFRMLTTRSANPRRRDVRLRHKIFAQARRRGRLTGVPAATFFRIRLFKPESAPSWAADYPRSRSLFADRLITLLLAVLAALLSVTRLFGIASATEYRCAVSISTGLGVQRASPAIYRSFGIQIFVICQSLGVKNEDAQIAIIILSYQRMLATAQHAVVKEPEI